MSPYLKLTTLGVPLGGQAVKHRQLVCQVGVRIEGPPVNSMASFKFTSAVLHEGTTFVFGSRVCVADGAGDFRQFTIDVMKSKTFITGFHSELDEFVDNLDNLLTHASVFNQLPTEGYTQGGKFWVRRRRDQELEGARNTKLR
jgi:hypothetical protein